MAEATPPCVLPLLADGRRVTNRHDHFHVLFKRIEDGNAAHLGGTQRVRRKVTESSRYSIMSIFSPRSSRMMDCTRILHATHAPTLSTSRSRLCCRSWCARRLRAQPPDGPQCRRRSPGTSCSNRRITSSARRTQPRRDLCWIWLSGSRSGRSRPHCNTPGATAPSWGGRPRSFPGPVHNRAFHALDGTVHPVRPCGPEYS